MQPDPHYVLAFSMPGGMEWVVVLIVALLIFGSRLPGIMRSLGGSIREFKKGIDTEPESDRDRVKPVDGVVSRPNDPSGHGDDASKPSPPNH
jgi:sec-independent protein translocase protein TatA